MPINNEKRESKSKIRELELKIKNLEKELNDTKILCVQMIEQRALAFYEKEQLENELESLTQSLFEEANKLVADERRVKAELEKSNVKLSEDLSEALKKLELGINSNLTSKGSSLRMVRSLSISRK